MHKLKSLFVSNNQTDKRRMAKTRFMRIEARNISRFFFVQLATKKINTMNCQLTSVITVYEICESSISRKDIYTVAKRISIRFFYRMQTSKNRIFLILRTFTQSRVRSHSFILSSTTSQERKSARQTMRIDLRVHQSTNLTFRNTMRK